jgi:hypothetical protein
VATKLTATLSRAAMRNDVWINWTPFCETRNRFFSWQGALTTALNWGTGLSAAGLLTVCLLAFFNEVHKTKFPRRVRIVMVTSIILTGLFYLFLPKTEVRVVGYYHDDIKEHHLALEYVYANRGGRTIAETRTDLGKLISTSSTNAMWHENLVNFDNYLVGGQIREEDSPGNYTIRETNGQLEFVSYDAQAAEHIQTLVPW